MNKKSIKALLFTVLLFSAIFLINVTKSYPIYFEANDKALAYNINLKNTLYGGTGTITRLETSTPITAHLQFSLKRNPNTLDFTSSNNQDRYILNLPSGCQVLRIITRGSYYSSGVIMYSDNNDDTAIVTLTCEARTLKDKDNLLAQVGVFEEISNTKFKYMDFSYSEPTSSYPTFEYTPVFTYTVTGDKTIEDMYLAYIAWLEDENNGYAYKKLEYSKELIKYIGSSYFGSTEPPYLTASANKLIAEITKSTRPGLQVTKTGDTYKFEIDEDNIIGYARTFTAVSNNTLYFSAMNITPMTDDIIEKLNAVFEVYLEYYLYQGEENSALRQKIMNYVNSQAPKGIYSILNGDVSLPVFHLGSEKGQLSIDVNDLKRYALEMVDHRSFQIMRNTYVNMLNDTMVLLKTIDDTIISPAMKAKFLDLKQMNYIMSLAKHIIKNSTDYGKDEPFVDYMTILDEGSGKYLIVKFYYDGTDNFNHVEFATIDLIPNMSFKTGDYTNTYNEFTLNYTYNSTADIKTVKQDIDAFVNDLSNIIGNVKTVNIIEMLDASNNKTGQYKVSIVFDKEYPLAYSQDIKLSTKETMKTDIIAAINEIDDTIISSALKTSLSEGNSLFDQIVDYATKNNTDNDTVNLIQEKTPFKDYITVYDETNKHYVLIKISSDGTINKIEVATIELLDNMTLSFNNNDTNLDVNLEYTPSDIDEATIETNIDNTIDKITWFTGKMTAKEVKKEENNNITTYHINFSVKKYGNIDYRYDINFDEEHVMLSKASIELNKIDSSIISGTDNDGVKANLMGNQTFIKAVVKNNKAVTDKIAFTDYMVIYDGVNNHYVLIKISSDTTKNTVTFSKITLFDNMTMDMDNDNITIVYKPFDRANALEDINLTINNLTLLVGEVDNDILEEVDEQNNTVYTVTLTIKK